MFGHHGNAGTKVVGKSFRKTKNKLVALIPFLVCSACKFTPGAGMPLVSRVLIVLINRRIFLKWLICDVTERRVSASTSWGPGTDCQVVGREMESVGGKSHQQAGAIWAHSTRGWPPALRGTVSCSSPSHRCSHGSHSHGSRSHTGGGSSRSRGYCSHHHSHHCSHRSRHNFCSHSTPSYQERTKERWGGRPRGWGGLVFASARVP